MIASCQPRDTTPFEVDRDPLRVVHVVPNLCTGGMERLVVQMLERADRSQVVPRAVCIGQRGELADEAERLGISVLALESPLRRNPRLPFRLARCFRGLRADIIHTHGPYAQFYGSLAAFLAGGLPVVHTMHGFPWPRTFRRRLLGRVSNAMTRYIVAVSHDLAGYARRELKAPAERLAVIHNGIDVARLNCTTREVDGPQYSALMVARLSTEKDFPSLIEAVDSVRCRHRSFRLAIAGDGPQRSEIERQIERLGLDNHVELLGNRSDVPRLLSRSQAFVLSTHTEGISIALLEAMACGVPVVATAVGGNPEIVVNGECGFLVPPKSPDDLAGRLMWLMDHPQEARDMGAAARRRVEEKFHVRAMTAAYESLYRQSVGVKDVPAQLSRCEADSMAEVQG